MHRQKSLLAMSVSLIIIFIFFSSPAQSTAGDSTHFKTVVGSRINNGVPVFMMGYIFHIDGDFYTYAGADLGTSAASISGMVMMRLLKYNRLELFSCVGPQAEIIETNPPPDDPTSYLTAASGLVVTYSHHERISISLMYIYLFTDADISPHKIGVLVSFFP